MPGTIHDVRGRRLFWLLDIQWAGKTIRLSDATVIPTDAIGNMYAYHGRIDRLTVTEEINISASGTAPITSVPVACVFPVDVPLLVAQGHDLASATGTLSRWIEDTPWEQRQVVLVGSIRDPEYGAADEPVNFSLEATPWDDSEVIPGPDQMVTGANWDDDMILSLAAEELGLYYPIIIGRPGVVSTAVDSDGFITGSQGVWADHQRRDSHNETFAHHFGDLTLVVAGHHVTAQSVYGVTADYSGGLRFYVRNGYDRNGHPIAFLSWWSTKPVDADNFVYDAPTAAGGGYVWTYDASNATVSSIGAATVDSSFQPNSGQSKSVFIAWRDDDDTTRGGIAGTDGLPIRGAADVLHYLLSRSGIPTDRGRFLAAGHVLNRYKLDFSIDAQCKPWEFAKANLLPLLPVSIASGDAGLYPVVWRIDATAHDATCHLDRTSDPRMERASAVSYDRAIYNDWTLQYAMSIRTGAYCGQIRMSASAEEGALSSFYCARSQARYRRSDGAPLVAPKTIQTFCVYDDTTASLILQWMSRLYAFARRRVDYILPERKYATLYVGQVVTVTDPDLYLEAQVALIESVQVDGSPMMRVRLLMIEDPVRDTRLT